MKVDRSRVCSFTRLLLGIAVGLSLIGAGSVAKADDTAYMATGGGAFGTIDLTTGVFTQLGLSKYPVMGLAVIGTTLYGAGQGDNNQIGQLYSVDPANGLLTAIGQPTGIQYTGFGSLNNTLYAIDNTSANPNLYSIDSSTGAATKIGPLIYAFPLAGYWSLSNNSTALYFQLNSTLYTLNTTTGQASPVGPMGGGIQVGAIVEVNGTLYAGQDSPQPPLRIITLNKSTGAVTVGPNVTNSPGSNASYIYGLAPIISSFASSDTFFPQIAVGGGWSTSFTLSNTGSTATSGTLILKDRQGKPLTVNTAIGIGSSFPVSILPGGAMFLTINSLGANDPTTSGWATVETTGGSLDGVATYQFVSQGVIQNVTGVLSFQATQFATVPVNDSTSQNRSTAIAIANPTSQSITIKIALVDPDGVVVDDTVSQTLNPGQQITKFFYDIFLNRPTFQGSMVLRAQGGGTFAIVALVVQNQQIYTAIPVIPIKAPNIPN